MQTREIGTMDIRTAKDWDLVVAVASHMRETNLAASLARAVRAAVWANQDGYGEPGFTPCQGWDWSGIRDSSEQAVADMAAAARKILSGAGVGSITVSEYVF